MRLEPFATYPNIANDDCNDDDVVIAVYVRDSRECTLTLKGAPCWYNSARYHALLFRLIDCL